MYNFEIEDGTLVRYRGAEAHVVIPDGITEVGSESFVECSFMKSIKFPATITKIGEYSFCNCTGLEEIIIPASVKEISCGAFFHCISLKRVVIEGDTVIMDRAFQSCTKLESVETYGEAHPDGMFIFDGCSKLVDENGYIIIANVLCEYHGRKQRITIPPEVVKISDYAFRETNIKSVKFPPALEKIGEGAFSKCDYLERIELPSGIKEVPKSAFARCYRLEEVILPETVERIAEEAFTSCMHLVSVKLPESLKELNGFRGCLSLEKIYVPDSVEVIGYGTFSDCRRLRHVRLPKRFAKQQPVWYKDRFLYDIIPAVVLDNYGHESKAEVSMLGFLTKRTPKHIRSLVAIERLDLVSTLLDIQGPSSDEITKYIDTFAGENLTELVAILLEYRGSHSQKIGELYSLDDVEPSDKKKRR